MGFGVNEDKNCFDFQEIMRREMAAGKRKKEQGKFLRERSGENPPNSSEILFARNNQRFVDIAAKGLGGYADVKTTWRRI